MPDREIVRLDDEDLNIYINDDEEEFNELDSYLEERRSNFKVRYSSFNIYINLY